MLDGVIINTYDSYYYDNSLQAHEAPDGYDINKIISLKNFGIENFSKVTDMECDSKGNLYILSSESGEVIVLDSSFNYSKTIKPIFLEEDNCIGANGIFIYESKNQNTIYFADTEHERIIHTDMEGNIIKILKILMKLRENPILAIIEVNIQLMN